MKNGLTKEQTYEKQGTLIEGLKDFFKIIWRNKMSRVGLIIVTLFILIAIFGPLLVADPVSNFGVRLRAPSAQHWLGTDYAGRDIFSMFIKGTRTVLMVALYAGIFAVVIADDADDVPPEVLAKHFVRGGLSRSALTAEKKGLGAIVEQRAITR